VKVLCYIYEGMADFEITLLLHRLRNTGMKEIITISEGTDKIIAQSGMAYLPELTIDGIKSLDDIEALIIPGGPINQQQNAILDLVRQMISSRRLVAAICFGPQFLGRAGVLDNYRFTTSCSAEKIKSLGCADPFNWDNYLEQRVVADRNLITAQGYAFVDFACAVADYMGIFADDKQRYEQLGRVKES